MAQRVNIHLPDELYRSWQDRPDPQVSLSSVCQDAVRRHLAGDVESPTALTVELEVGSEGWTAKVRS
jgi:hypothetical protein